MTVDFARMMTCTDDDNALMMMMTYTDDDNDFCIYPLRPIEHIELNLISTHIH
jgi:hypothetical protein